MPQFYPEYLQNWELSWEYNSAMNRKKKIMETLLYNIQKECIKRECLKKNPSQGILLLLQKKKLQKFLFHSVAVAKICRITVLLTLTEGDPVLAE